MSALPVPPSRVEQVYDAIIDEICSGALPGGTILRQELLADRFQISRQPIQHALLLLKSHGLVREAANRRGLEVVPIDETFVIDLYEVRGALEGVAARRAAKVRTAHQLDTLEKFLDDGERALRESSFAHMISADMGFHEYTLKIANNAVLLDNSSAFFHNSRRVMGEVLHRSGTPQWVWDEHRKIYEAIAEGDSAEAGRRAVEHAEHGTQLVLAAMRGEYPG